MDHERQIVVSPVEDLAVHHSLQNICRRSHPDRRYGRAKVRMQVRTAWAETRRRYAMRCIDTPRRDHRTALIFIVRGVPRGVVRAHWYPHSLHGFLGLSAVGPWLTSRSLWHRGQTCIAILSLRHGHRCPERGVEPWARDRHHDLLETHFVEMCTFLLQCARRSIFQSRVWEERQEARATRMRKQRQHSGSCVAQPLHHAGEVLLTVPQLRKEPRTWLILPRSAMTKI
jgi:hypothetical protein